MAMRRAYAQHRLQVNESKSVRRVTRHTFWGADLDGVRGQVGPPAPRLQALCALTLDVARLGVATVELLMVLAGSWVSVLVFKRRMLSLLDLIFVATQGRSLEVMLALSGELRTELLLLSVLAPLSRVNLRAVVRPEVWASDASDTVIATGRAPVPPALAEEFYRHGLKRGVWTKLLSGPRGWLRAHDYDVEGPELPGESLEQSPLRDLVASRVAFEVTWVGDYAKATHINLGEIGGILASEAQAGSAHPSSRIVALADSQVALGAIAKGRSASPPINGLLVASLATVLGSDVSTVVGWVGTLMNPLDDPTRNRPLRPPAGPWPFVFDEVAAGRYEAFDALVARGGEPLLADLAAHGSAAAEEGGQRLADAAALPSPSKTLSSDRCHHPGLGGAEDHHTRNRAGNPGGEGFPPLSSSTHHRNHDLVLLRAAQGGNLRIVSSRGNGDSRELPTGQGFVDLSSAGRSVAGALAKQAGTWTVVARSEALEAAPVDWVALGDDVCELIASGAVRGVFVAPAVRTFSGASRQYYRSRCWPGGQPGLGALARGRVDFENKYLELCLRVYQHASQLGVPAVFEIPSGTLVTIMRVFKRYMGDSVYNEVGIAECRFGAMWRRKLRIFSNIAALTATGYGCLHTNHDHQFRSHFGSSAQVHVLKRPKELSLYYAALLTVAGYEEGACRARSNEGGSRPLAGAAHC